MRVFLSLIFCVGMNLSAQEQLDFEERQPFTVISEVDSLEIATRKFKNNEYVLEGNGLLIPVADTHREDLIDCISQSLNIEAQQKVKAPGKYQTWFACTTHVDGRPVGLLEDVVAEFEVDESLEIPEHAVTVKKLRFPLGHFHVSGIARARIMATRTDDQTEFAYADSESNAITLVIVSDVVKFGTEIIGGARDLIAIGFIDEDVRIVFDYTDGSRKEFDLSGNLLGQPDAPTITVATGVEGIVIAVSGTPLTSYTILETHDLHTWIPLGETVHTDVHGHAEVTDLRTDTPCRFFKIQ